MSKLRSAVELALIAIALFLTAYGTARPQTQGGGFLFNPLGYCQIASVTSSTALPLTSCLSGSFTGTGAGTNLTASAVTGTINVGQVIAGTGVPAGTTVTAQTSGPGGCINPVAMSATCPTGGAGVYVTSAATTSSGASLTAGGVPTGAKYATIRVTQSINWRDDGAAPTTALGIQVNSTDVQGLWYSARLSAIQFIAVSTTGAVNVAFYGGQP